jgi:hypothetical protein
LAQPVGEVKSLRPEPLGNGAGVSRTKIAIQTGNMEKEIGVKNLAKDGTARGGARMGSGPKRKALTEKISAGKAATIIDLPEVPHLEGVDMPPVKEYMKAKQKNGTELCAEEIFEETWEWLKKVKYK